MLAQHHTGRCRNPAGLRHPHRPSHPVGQPLSICLRRHQVPGGSSRHGPLIAKQTAGRSDFSNQLLEPLPPLIDPDSRIAKEFAPCEMSEAALPKVFEGCFNNRRIIHACQRETCFGDSTAHINQGNPRFQYGTCHLWRITANDDSITLPCCQPARWSIVDVPLRLTPELAIINHVAGSQFGIKEFLQDLDRFSNVLQSTLGY